ncbi:MAG: hypothetical protein HRU25_06755, partial [Psychrobium sp.]|nr:hypothetical protein [Psychrobium sp.]
MSQSAGIILMLALLVGLLISNKIRPAILFIGAITVSYLLDWISLD